MPYEGINACTMVCTEYVGSICNEQVLAAIDKTRISRTQSRGINLISMIISLTEVTFCSSGGIIYQVSGSAKHQCFHVFVSRLVSTIASIFLESSVLV